MTASELTLPELTARVELLRQRIVDAGGTPETTRIVAVTKTFPPETAALAQAAGLLDLGENYSQELEQKLTWFDGLPAASDVRWHFIGGLQRNKVKRLAGAVALWQSVDRPELSTEIAKRAPGAAMLVQVNTTDEDQKSGCPPADVARLVEHSRGLGLDVRGLMTVGPTDGSDPSPCFAELRGLAGALDLKELSMGMTGDLEQAIREGSTMIRVGTALFGTRPAAQNK